MKSYMDLFVWQKSYDLCVRLFKITKKFPSDEKFVLVSQIRRASLSIPSNIAEGYSRRNKKEYYYFLRIAFGSARELETQLLLSRDLEYVDNIEYEQLNNLLTEVLKMLNVLIKKIKE